MIKYMWGNKCESSKIETVVKHGPISIKVGNKEIVELKEDEILFYSSNHNMLEFKNVKENKIKNKQKGSYINTNENDEDDYEYYDYEEDEEEIENEDNDYDYNKHYFNE